MTTSNETQALDVQAVVDGNQNFAIVEARKAPQTFNTLLGKTRHEGVDVAFRFSKEGAEIIVYQPGYLAAYEELLANRDNYQRYEFQIAMGTLLGYDDRGVQEYAANPVDCSCSKCGGHETKADRKAREQFAATIQVSA